MSAPKVSVIIVNYNGKILLEKCLESLLKVNYDNFEIILVDNNSTDGSIEYVIKNFPSVIVKPKGLPLLTYQKEIRYGQTQLTPLGLPGCDPGLRLVSGGLRPYEKKGD